MSGRNVINTCFHNDGIIILNCELIDLSVMWPSFFL